MSAKKQSGSTTRTSAAPRKPRLSDHQKGKFYPNGGSASAKAPHAFPTQAAYHGSIESWKSQTPHMLKQAFGARAFYSWQTHAIKTDDEDEVEQECADIIRF